MAEYPGSVERAAPPEDTPNTTALFKELRAALGKEGTISVATPAGSVAHTFISPRA